MLDENPKHLDALLLLGALLMDSQRLHEAEQTFATSLRLAPASVAAASGLAAALQALSRHKQAIAVLDSLLLLRAEHAVSWLTGAICCCNWDAMRKRLRAMAAPSRWIPS